MTGAPTLFDLSTHSPTDVSTTAPTDTTHTITVHAEDGRHDIEAEAGITLRQALRRHGLSPHNAVTDIANCGGRGHCGLCTVEILEGAPPPTQALDSTLDGVGLGRLSCLVTVDREMTVQL
ncbi:2Fe-2S iron-sulfur cluster-binding protein [Salinibacter sp.]|uniref:2Fe-2S iron-sulfur cluster-binding protein n=1 Tax=Salinibacter sp. TaxID=2065818 RepID=UPI002FC2D0E5